MAQDQSDKADASQRLLDLLAGWHAFVADKIDEPNPGDAADSASYTTAYSDATFEVYQRAADVFMHDDPEMSPVEFMVRHVLPLLD